MSFGLFRLRAMYHVMKLIPKSQIKPHYDINQKLAWHTDLTTTGKIDSLGATSSPKIMNEWSLLFLCFNFRLLFPKHRSFKNEDIPLCQHFNRFRSDLGAMP